jgi:hypothetical protein
MTIAFVDGPVITGDGRKLEHATVLVDNIDILLDRDSIRLVMQGGNIVRDDLD